MGKTIAFDHLWGSPTTYRVWGSVVRSPSGVRGIAPCAGHSSGWKQLSVLFKRRRMPLVEMFVVNWRPVRRRLLMKNHTTWSSRGRSLLSPTPPMDLPRIFVKCLKHGAGHRAVSVVAILPRFFTQFIAVFAHCYITDVSYLALHYSYYHSCSSPIQTTHNLLHATRQTM